MFTVDQLVNGLGYTPLQLREFFKTIGFQKTPAGDTELGPNHVLLLWVVMLIDNLAYLPADSRKVLAEHVVDTCADVGQKLLTTRDLTPMLVIADNAVATWYNCDGWLDLTTGEFVTEQRPAALETRGYHLCTLWHRNIAALQLRIRKNADHTTDRPSGTAQAADVT